MGFWVLNPIKHPKTFNSKIKALELEAPKRVDT